MEIPTQIISKVNVALFNLLPKSFISPIEAKVSIPHHKGTDFHKGLEYNLKPSFLQTRVQDELGEDALSLSYIGIYVNKQVDDEWTRIKPLKHHTSKDICHTGGIGFRLMDENEDLSSYPLPGERMEDIVSYNKMQILRVVRILEEIGVNE